MSWNFKMHEASHSFPIIVWDEYFYMRIAMWDHEKGKFVVDQPCCEEGEGQELNPICWQPCPPLPNQPREPWQEPGQRCGWTDTGICQARVAKGCEWPACSRERRE